MTTLALTDCLIFAGAYDLRSQTNELSVSQMVEELDKTTFGSAGVKERTGGLRDVEGSIKGFADPLVSDDLFAQVGGSDLIVSIAPYSAAGSAIYATKGSLVGAFTNTEEVGALRAFEAKLTGRNPRGLVRGSILRAHSAATASAVTTAFLIGTASSAQTVCSWVHLTAISGATATLTVTIQRDDNSGMTTPTTLHAHSAQTAIGTSWQETAGAITDTYYRVSFTLTGTTPSATFLVGLGIA